MYTYTYIHVHMYVCIYIYIYICMYVCMYAYIDMYVFVCVYIYIYIYHANPPEATGDQVAGSLSPSQGGGRVWPLRSVSIISIFEFSI